MSKTLLVYYGNYYEYEGDIYGFLPEVILITNLLHSFKKVTLLAPLKYVNKKEDINPLFVKFENKNVEILRLPFYNNRFEALKQSFKLSKYLKGVKSDYALVSQVMYNSMKIASILGSNGVKVSIYIGSNPLEILKSKQLKKNWFFKKIGSLYYKYLIYETNKYKCLVNGEKLFNDIKLNNKYIVNSSTLFKVEAAVNEITIDQNKLLFVGRLTHSKRVDLLIEMIKLLKVDYPNIRLNIIGDGELKNKLKSLVFKYDLIQNVNFLGALTDRVLLHNEYKTSKLFVFSSISEGNPRVIKEATFFKLPSVSTRVGNLENEYEDGKNIMFVDFENVNQLVQKVRFLLEQKEVYDSFRKNLAIHKVHTVEDFVSDLTDLITKE